MIDDALALKVPTSPRPNKSYARKALEKLIKANPGKTEKWCMQEFTKLARDDDKIIKSVLEDTFDEVGFDGLSMLMRPATARH